MHSHRVLIRQLAVEHQGTGEEYEHFKRMVDASPLLYPHDFQFYNDDVASRHLRNIAELRYIQQLIADNKVHPAMLPTNTYNAYYPSYVLHHHYSVYLPLLKTLGHKDLLQQAQRSLNTGAFFHETKTQSLNAGEKSYPVLDEQGTLRMDPKTFFYSPVTSPYITQCAFLSRLPGGGLALTIVGIRDEEGKFRAGVKTRDFGATISSDYLPVGYNFEGVKPSFIIPVEDKLARKVGAIAQSQTLTEFSFSLKDLQKSLWLTVKYTSMRKQFQTLDDSKEERRIITYQAVAARVIDGFSQFQALSDLYNKIKANGRSYLLVGDLLQSSHHLILEALIHLRECCGGFGYMQYSGHPGCMERVCNRAGNEPQQTLRASKALKTFTHFPLSSPELQHYYIQKVTGPQVQYIQFFSVFLSICRRMESESSSLPVLDYRREFLRQAGILAMHEKENFSRYEADNVHCQLLQYALYSYILRNAKYIDWTLITLHRTAFYSQLQDGRALSLQRAIREIGSLCQTLELEYLRNTIVGREDEQEFYLDLLRTSRDKNMRNSEEYREYVRAPIVEMVGQARAKL